MTPAPHALSAPCRQGAAGIAAASPSQEPKHSESTSRGGGGLMEANRSLQDPLGLGGYDSGDDSREVGSLLNL